MYCVGLLSILESEYSILSAGLFSGASGKFVEALRNPHSVAQSQVHLLTPSSSLAIQFEKFE